MTAPAAKRLRRTLRRWRTIAVLALLPTVSRERLIAEARRRGACHVIEPAYTTPAPDGTGSLAVSAFVVVTVPDVLLVGPGGLPVTRDGRIIKEPVAAPRGHLYLPAVERAVAQLGLLRLLRMVWFSRWARSRGELPSIAAGVHVITRAGPRSGGSQYAHWFLEHAAQLAAVETVRPELPADLVHVTNADVAPYQTDLFELLGVTVERIVPHVEPVLHVGQLIVATLRNGHSTGSEYDPHTYRRVRARLTGRRPPTTERTTTGPTLVAMLRAGERKRRTLNLDAVQDVVRAQQGHLLPDAAPLVEELELLRDCRVMVGIHGAGLVKMLMAPRLTEVIELLPPVDQPPTLYAALAAGLGIRYRRIVGTLPEGAQQHGKNADFIVPVDELAAALEEALKGPPSPDGTPGGVSDGARASDLETA